MNYCNHCGVELDDHMESCPLCGLTAGEKYTAPEEPAPGQPKLKDKIVSEYESLTPPQKRKLFWEISGIILGSDIIVTFIINLIISKEITWSKYVLIASFTVFINISAFRFFRKRPYLFMLTSFSSLAILLITLDLMSFAIGWGSQLALPILVALYTLTMLVVLWTRRTKQKGLNVLATSLIAIGLFMISIEGCISFYLNHHLIFSWSIIATVSILPIAALLLFIHYKLKRGIELKRFFHI